jgi:hypothetical protein
MRHIEHKGLGLAFDLPDLSQDDVEKFFRVKREMETGGLHEERIARAKAVVATLQGMTQKDVGLFFQSLEPGTVASSENLSVFETAGNHVRAAIKCGWLKDATEEMTPAAVLWLYERVLGHITEACTVPPE